MNEEKPNDLIPSVDQVYKYLLYGLSLPERTIRSTTAVVSGAVNESAQLLIPQAFQDSKTYKLFVQQMIDMLANDVGGVGLSIKEASGESAADTSVGGSGENEAELEGYIARKTVSSFVDFAGMATFHLSPLTILAIISDVAYGSQKYLDELTEALKAEGAISKDSTIKNTAQLLEAIGAASSDAADTMDLPPINLEGLKDTIEKTQENLLKIDPTQLIPLSEIDSMWSDISKIAIQEDVDIFSVSSAITMFTVNQIGLLGNSALATVRVTTKMLNEHLIDHYRKGIDEIYEKGLAVSIAESSEPYLEAVWYNFSARRPTITEDFISGKMAERFSESLMGWFTSEPIRLDDESGE